MRSLVASALLVLGALTGCGGEDETAPPVAGELGEVVTFPGELPRDHVEGDVDYPHDPPIGGAHAPVWQTCGFYLEAVPEERAVHSMEHGAVWVTYRPGLTEAQLELLAELAGDYVLVSPREDLPAPIVASAWGVQLRVATPNAPALLTFVDEYASGAQTPEPGAPCVPGEGTPDA